MYRDKRDLLRAETIIIIIALYRKKVEYIKICYNMLKRSVVS